MGKNRPFWLRIIIAIFFILLLSGCKEVTYIEKVPYQIEESYYVDESYEIDVPVLKTKTVIVNKTREIPIIVDNLGNEIQPLEFRNFSMNNNERTFPYPLPCWVSFETYNPNEVNVYFDLHYIFDIWNYPQPVIDRKEQFIEANGTYYQRYSGQGNTRGCKIKDLKAEILVKGNVTNSVNIEIYQAEEQQEYTAYEKKIRTRRVPKTRTITKYQERLVTEKKLL